MHSSTINETSFHYDGYIPENRVIINHKGMEVEIPINTLRAFVHIIDQRIEYLNEEEG